MKVIVKASGFIGIIWVQHLFSRYNQVNKKFSMKWYHERDNQCVALIRIVIADMVGWWLWTINSYAKITICNTVFIFISQFSTAKVYKFISARI